MADEANAPLAADAAKPVEEPTRPIEVSEGAAVAEAKPADDGDVVPAVNDAEVPKTAAAAEDQAAKDDTMADAKLDTTETGASADTAPAADSTTTDGTPAAKKANNNRRKSTGGGIPEHKKKTPNKKKKAPELHLNTQPGDMWMVAMRGYQPWPVIICDEEMLPETLIVKRPVSAKRIDGTYREDFREGGKNAKDRRYPIMFLGTNEFAWQVNTELLPFDIEEVKKQVEDGNSQKKNKALWDAYVVASEGHDLQWFKEMLKNHENAMREDEAVKKRKAEDKAKKEKRKSSVVEESDDVDMEDADDDALPSAKKAKASKKRKKDDLSDGEPEKPAKTPKTKLKLNNKPKDASAANPKKDSKSKKAKASDSEDAELAAVEEPPMTEEERLQKREKSVLYLRHRLQKGFLSRDQAPKEEEMPNMSGFLKQLEDYEDLEPEVIKNTKVHKVLKAIIKLNTIPKEEEFNFKQRSNNLLTKWTGALAVEAEPPTADAATSAAPTTAAAPITNGVKHDEDNTSELPATGKSEGNDTAAVPEGSKPADADGDVSMTEAKDETPVTKDDAPASAEGAVQAAVAAAT